MLLWLLIFKLTTEQVANCVTSCPPSASSWERPPTPHPPIFFPILLFEVFHSFRRSQDPRSWLRCKKSSQMPDALDQPVTALFYLTATLKLQLFPCSIFLCFQLISTKGHKFAVYQLPLVPFLGPRAISQKPKQKIASAAPLRSEIQFIHFTFMQ